MSVESKGEESSGTTGRLDPRMALGLLFVMLGMFCDGYDLAALGFVAPELVSQWGIPASALVPAFTTSIVGLAIGSAVLGWAADRWGKRRVIVCCLLAAGVSTFAIPLTQSPAQLAVVRLITGIAIGGVIPAIIAVGAQLCPKRIRGRLLVIIFALGTPLGVAAPGLVAGWLAPHFGWAVVPVVGGAMSILVAIGCAIALPGRTTAAPSPANEAGSSGDATRARDPGLSIRNLLEGDLRLITPLFAVCLAANQMAYYYAVSWLPLVLKEIGETPAHAGLYASMFSLGGAASGLLLLFIIDRLGALSLLLLFAFGTPLIVAMTLADLAPPARMLAIAAAGFCVTGNQIGISTLMGIFYPERIRSFGSGVVHASGRLGAICAPIIIGALLDLHVGASYLALAPAVFLAAGAVGAALIARRCWTAFGSFRAAEFDVPKERIPAQVSPPEPERV